MQIRRSKLESTTSRTVSLVIMIIISVLCLLPFVLMISASLTGE